jgi:hypothetical protein
MLYLLGTDEAGYGPNLGPLVVAATLWKVSGVGFQPALPDLYELLADGICSDPNVPLALPSLSVLVPLPRFR